MGKHFFTKASETDRGTRRRCANLSNHPAELPSKHEFQAKDRRSPCGCWDSEYFRLVGSAQWLLFPIIIYPGGFMYFMNQRTGQFCSSPLPPSAFPSRVSGLALHLPAAAPLSAQTGGTGVRAQGGGARLAPLRTILCLRHRRPAAPELPREHRGLRRAHGRQKRALESPHTHIYMYIHILRTWWGSSHSCGVPPNPNPFFFIKPKMI